MGEEELHRSFKTKVLELLFSNRLTTPFLHSIPTQLQHFSHWKYIMGNRKHELVTSEWQLSGSRDTRTNENKLSTTQLDEEDVLSPPSTSLIYKHKQTIRIRTHHSSNCSSLQWSFTLDNPRRDTWTRNQPSSSPHTQQSPVPCGPCVRWQHYFGLSECMAWHTLAALWTLAHWLAYLCHTGTSVTPVSLTLLGRF